MITFFLRFNDLAVDDGSYRINIFHSFGLCDQLRLLLKIFIMNESSQKVGFNRQLDMSVEILFLIKTEFPEVILLQDCR